MPHLIRQSESLLVGKIPSQIIYEIGKLSCFLPDIERVDFENSRPQKLPNVRAPLRRLPPREPVS